MASPKLLLACSLLAVLAFTESVHADSCAMSTQKCNGNYVINDEPGTERFYVHRIAEKVSAWKRVSDQAHCGIRSCSKTLSFSDQTSNTITNSKGQSFSVGEAHSSTSKKSFANTLSVGASAKFLGIGVSVDNTFAVNWSSSKTNCRSTTSGQSRTYAVATGQTFSRSESLTCNGNPGDKFYLKTQHHWLEFNGNFCKFSHKDGSNQVWKCEYIEAKIQAILPGTNQMDMNIMCETQRDSNVQLGCRSVKGSDFESFCQSNGQMGYCPSSHCTQ